MTNTKWSPVMETPTGPAYPTNTAAEWGECAACGNRDWHIPHGECHTCGYTATCHTCGTDINATDYYTVFTCSRHCDDELNAWNAADETIGRYQ